METTDRLWWLEGLFGLGFAVAATIYPVHVLSTLLPLDEELGQPITQDLLLAAVSGGLFLVLALVLVIMSVRAHTRTRRRAVALRGQMDAMPLARLTADPAKAPDVSREPLVLFWRTAKSVRYVQNTLFVLHLLVVAAGIGVAVFGFGLLLFSNRVPDSLRFLAGLGMLVLLALLVAGTVVAARYIPTLFGRPYGVTADGEGITYRTTFGGRRLLPWSEMRLFEVSGSGQGQLSVRRFALYGDRVRVPWTDGPSIQTEVEPAGISAEEMALRQRALLDLIAARTGLQPRTFSRALSATAPGAQLPPAFTIVAIFVVIIALCLGPAVAVLLLPLTASAIFNDAMAAPLALLALVLVVRGVMLTLQALARPRVSTPASVSLPNAPPLDAPHTTCILRLRTPPLRQLGFALLGAALVIEIVPMLLVMAILPSSIFQVLGTDALPQVHGGWAKALAVVLAVFGFVGIFMLYGVIFVPNTVIRADAAGLSINLTRSPSFLSWDSVEDIAARMRRGTVNDYVVRGDAGRVVINWSARRSLVVDETPSDGALPIGPDELAALVVKRSGKQLRVTSGL